MILKFVDFIVESNHDDIAKDILEKIKSSESKVDVFADYKRGIKIGDKYVSVIKSLGRGRFSSSLLVSNRDTYKLVINNVHYNSSKRIVKDIWNLLSKRADEEKYKQ